MKTKFVLFLVGLAATIAVPTAPLGGSPTASACSCLFSPTADAIGESDVVFVGSVMSRDGPAERPVWTFAVDGVVKGTLGPTIEVIGGDIGGAGCGTDFELLDGPSAIFADWSDDGLTANICTSNPPVDEFRQELSDLELPNVDPNGAGPPAAVMVGAQGPYDLAIVDSKGVAIARATVGAHGRSAAHCPGTTKVALSPVAGRRNISIVDLATMTVVAERRSAGDPVYLYHDRLFCLEGGDRVISVTGVESGAGVTVTSNSAGSGDTATPSTAAGSAATESGPAEVERTFEDPVQIVVDRAGTVLVLRRGSIEVLAADNLEPVVPRIDLADDATPVAADTSLNGSELALIATTEAEPTDPDQAFATEVVTFDLNGGVPDPSSAETVSLSAEGRSTSLEEVSGFRWVDERTWVVEYRPGGDQVLAFIGTDGVLTGPPIPVEHGFGLVPVDGGVLRSRDAGMELVGNDGRITALDPAPHAFGSLNLMQLDRLVEAPVFDPPPTDVAPLTIRQPAPVDPAKPEAQPATQQGVVARYRRWLIVAAVLVMFGWITTAVVSRRRAGHVGGEWNTE